MSAAPFAAVDALISEGMESLLTDSTATYQGGQPFGVIMERGQTDAFGGGGVVVDAPEVACSFHIRHTPGLTEGGELVINGVRHRVGQGVQPDSSGWVTVQVFAAE